MSDLVVASDSHVAERSAGRLEFQGGVAGVAVISNVEVRSCNPVGLIAALNQLIVLLKVMAAGRVNASAEIPCTLTIQCVRVLVDIDGGRVA